MATPYMKPMDSLALYIHWPFCLAKCPYCDFNSHVRDRIPQARFAAALRSELAHEAARLGPREVRSIFFGGGTPSLMEPATTAALIEDAARLFTLAPDCEITLEANPTSVEAGRLAAFREAGGEPRLARRAEPVRDRPGACSAGNTPRRRRSRHSRWRASCSRA